MREIWRRRNGSLGSVSEGLRVRAGGRVSWFGGGRSEDRRMGGSISWGGGSWRDLRFGDEDVGVVEPDVDSLWSLGRSVDAKFRHDGLRRGVDSPEGRGRTMVFMHVSHIPDAEFIPPLHVLQMATVDVDSGQCLLC